MTNEAGDRVDRSRPTEFGRALGQLGIQMIAAYSPEARGRSERFFKALQDRLPKEMALESIHTMEAANAFLKRFWPRFNRRFTVKPRESAVPSWRWPASIWTTSCACRLNARSPGTNG